LAPRLREEVWAALPEGVEVRFLDEPWPKACDLFIPPYGQEEVVRRVLEEVEVKVVQTLSAGVDWILPLVPEGVVLCDGSGIHDAPVAEWVVLALLALLKDLSGFLEAQKEGRWAPRRLSDLEGKRVLLLGYGSIGKAVAERLRPFGVALFPVARHPRPGVYTREDLPALLPRADAVVLLLPLTPETRGIVDRDFLARMKEGALLVNAGRGGLVDTEALLEALAPGERTPAFRVHRKGLELASWYVRLPLPPEGLRPPLAGLLRVETPLAGPFLELADLSLGLFPALASHPVKDPRAPQNLLPVGGLERELSRRMGRPEVVGRMLARYLGGAR